MFNDPNLQKVYEETNSLIEERKRKLNSMSADIKSAEKLLKESSKSKYVCISGEGGLLKWSARRIVVCIDDNHGITIERPLIEMPLEIRLKYYKLLPLLLNDCLN